MPELAQHGVKRRVGEWQLFNIAFIPGNVQISDGRIFRSGSPRALAEDSEVRRIYLGDSFSLPPSPGDDQ